jgi:hypothetical protein
VNEHGGFGSWVSDVSFGPSDLRTILAKHARREERASTRPSG